ncbi:MAG: LysR family glycine cleavage system transcriptional activator [Gammaproteobacteria bacterium]
MSDQVKGLETELGVRLFNRAAQRLTLTEAGREYLAVIRYALDRIDAGTARLVQRQNTGRLTVSISPNFSSKWLVHRLGRFAQLHPDIDLRVSAALHHVDFANEDVDIAVRHSDGVEPELDCTRLMTEALFPVCSPGLLQGPVPLRSPEDLVHHSLLHLNDRNDWSKWLDRADLNTADLSKVPVLYQASRVIDAAVNGQGVALARTGLAAWDLTAGRLVRPFPLALPVSYAYWIVCPPTTSNLP